MNIWLLEILVILFLILINGAFAMSEIAIVSARKPRLQKRAGEGDAGARFALDLANTPGRFLSTVQIGITLIGILAGAISGATIAEELKVLFADLPGLSGFSEAISVGIVVIIVTYLSLVLGELAPKKIALNNPERVASLTAPPMKFLSRIVAPLVTVLTASTNFVVRAVGLKPASEPSITEEEIRILISQGTKLGVIEPAERDVFDQVLRLGDRNVSSLMTPRTEIVWLDLEVSQQEMVQKLIATHHAFLPVASGNLDTLHGFVRAKDLLTQCLNGEPIDLLAALQPPQFIPENTPAFYVLDRLKEAKSEIAFVIDEFGGVQGLVKLRDVLEAIVGDIPQASELEPEIFQRDDGSWLLDGLLPVDEFKILFDLQALPGVQGQNFDTLGGFIMTYLDRIPSPGDSFEWEGVKIEVLDMDGMRVDKVLVRSTTSNHGES